MAKEKNILTQKDYDKLLKEYRDLIDVQRPNVTEALALARSQGDLSENADYDAARARQAQIEERILEIEAIMNNHEIIKKDKKGDDTLVAIGDLVKFKVVGQKETLSVKIAGNTGADPMADIPTISNESPLGKAILGKKVGDEVRIEVDEPYSVSIVSVSEEA
jgi:transcription elongation factor GreA